MINQLTLPDPKKLIELMLTAEVRSGEKVSTWLGQEIKSINESRKWSSDKIFMTYATSLLARQSYGSWWSKAEGWFTGNVKYIENLPRPALISAKLKEFGYRWHPQGGHVITQAKEIFLNKYMGSWDNYFRLADEKYEEDFPDDYFLKIKNVGFKVRDLALSLFSPKYVAIDSHVVDVLRRTGLICYAYQLGLGMTTDPTKEKDYLILRKLCIHLSKLAGLQPRELDRLFWYYGKHICPARNMKCKHCTVKELCVTRMY
jgi:endonuclease III